MLNDWSTYYPSWVNQQRLFLSWPMEVKVVIQLLFFLHVSGGGLPEAEPSLAT